MTFYPECAATEEEDGPNFEAPVMGRAFQRGQVRLREAEAFSKVQREAHEFHERKARKYGLDHPVGLAHFKAARSYKEAGGKLQEMFDAQNQGQQPDPKAMAKAHKSAIKFHKGQAQKAGLDSPLGQAHVNALQTHMGGLKTAQQQIQAQKPPEPAPEPAGKKGYGNKQSPVPVPKKSEQPNEDIHQKKPSVPLAQLQKSKKEAINRFGEDEGGPGSGPRKAGNVAARDKHGEPTHIWTKKTIGGKSRMMRQPLDVEGGKFAKKMHDKGYSQGTFSGKEARGPDAGGKRMNPHSDREIMKPDLVYRGKKLYPGSYGPHAAKSRVHDMEQHGGTLDRESRRSLRR